MCRVNEELNIFRLKEFIHSKFGAMYSTNEFDHKDFERIDVRRQHLVSDAMRAFKRHQITGKAPLKVRFVGECGVDDGGPRRDFLTRVLQKLLDGPLVCGKAGHLLPAKNPKDLIEEKYYFLGMMVALSILQEGPCPSVFAT